MESCPNQQRSIALSRCRHPHWQAWHPARTGIILPGPNQQRSIALGRWGQAPALGGAGSPHRHGIPRSIELGRYGQAPALVPRIQDACRSKWNCYGKQGLHRRPPARATLFLLPSFHATGMVMTMTTSISLPVFLIFLPLILCFLIEPSCTCFSCSSTNRHQRCRM